MRPERRHPRWIGLALALVGAPLSSALAQSPRFDVASVKPNTSSEESIRWTFENGRFTGINITLRMLISTAYGPPQQPLPDFLIAGAPGWVATARFDVTGTAAPGAPLPPLLRHLVEDRFALRSHAETRDMPIYALTLAHAARSLGPMMRKNDRDCAAIASGAIAGERCGGQIVPGKVSARGMTMTQMVSGLARLMPNVGRPVVDRTALTGAFDIDLTWSPDQALANAMPGMPTPPIDPNGPSLFTALQEQLGLKLESLRGEVEVLVIDTVARPVPD